MTIEVALLVSLASLCISAYLGFKGSKRTDIKDVENRAKENAMINFKLDEIGRATQDIKTELTTMRTEINNQDVRLIRVEESTKSAHKRIDGIERTIQGGEGHERKEQTAD